MDRRQFLRGLLGVAAASTVTYILPPPCGWFKSKAGLLESNTKWYLGVDTAMKGQELTVVKFTFTEVARWPPSDMEHASMTTDYSVSWADKDAFDRAWHNSLPVERFIEGNSLVIRSLRRRDKQTYWHT